MEKLWIFEELRFHSSTTLHTPVPYGVSKGVSDRVGGRGVKGSPLEEVTPKHPAS